MKLRVSILAVLVFACSDPVEPSADLALLPASGSPRLALMWAAQRPDGRTAELGGFDGAVSGEVVVRDAAGAELARGMADAAGRISLVFDGVAGDTVSVTLDGVADPIQFRVRDPATALEDAVRPAVGGAGSVPNDLIIVGPAASARGVVVRSGDNAVSVFDLQAGLQQSGARLPEDGARFANPWFATAIDDTGKRVAVSAFGQRRVYIVDLDTGAVTNTLELGGPVRLSTPFQLTRPFDVDGDGTDEAEVSTFAPTAPQGVVVTGGRLFVAFSGFAAARVRDLAPVYLPAVLAAWDLADLDAPPDRVVLPLLNPQEIRVDEDGKLLVVCSGIVDQLMGAPAAATPGAVYRIDPATLAIDETYDLGDVLPGSAVVSHGALWVGSLKAGSLTRIAMDAIRERSTISLNNEEVDSVFRMVALPGGLIAVPSFNTDRLHLVDAATGELDPPPFYGPIPVGPGRPLFDGLKIIARRPGRPGVDYAGPDLFCLSDPASLVTPVQTLRVLGP